MDYFNTELLTELPLFNNITHKISIFYDVDRVDMTDSSKDTTFESRTLQNIGVRYQAYFKSFF